MIKVAIRLAGESDISNTILSAILNEAKDEIERWRGGEVLWEDRPSGEIADLLAKCLERDDALCVLGTLDEVVVGIGLVTQAKLANGDLVAKIQILYVLPGARGVGTGEAIMTALSEWAQDRGCQGIDAVALPGDRNTKNFFESHGMSARSLTLYKSIATEPIAAEPIATD